MFNNKKKEVWMDEMDFVVLPNNNGYITLKTYGLTTCIAICMRVITPNKTLLAMYHWPGDSTVSKKTIDKLYQICDNQKELSNELDVLDRTIKKSAGIALRKLHDFAQNKAQNYDINFYGINTRIEIEIIGGEAATQNTRGTVAEFNWLIHKAYKLCVAKKYSNCEIIPFFPKKHADQSGDVSMKKNSTYYKIDDVLPSLRHKRPRENNLDERPTKKLKI